MRKNQALQKNRGAKAERSQRNLIILIEKEIIPDELLANPEDGSEIGEEHHDELDVISKRSKFPPRLDLA